MKRIVIAIACLIAVPASADPVRAALDAIAKCPGIANAQERLKCYDAAADAHGFGLRNTPQPVTSVENFGRPEPVRREEVSEISANVLELGKTARGRALFVLDNGQTWRQIDSDSSEVREGPAGKPMRVTIAKGALGSYNLTIAGRAGLVKVNRLK